MLALSRLVLADPATGGHGSPFGNGAEVKWVWSAEIPPTRMTMGDMAAATFRSTVLSRASGSKSHSHVSTPTETNRGSVGSATALVLMVTTACNTNRIESERRGAGC